MKREMKDIFGDHYDPYDGDDGYDPSKLNEYQEVYEFDAKDAWLNGAYDENGNGVPCDMCGGEMKWNPVMQNYVCENDDQAMSRIEYFNYIGANPPGPDCLTNCSENYPVCKQFCTRYKIDPSDPMLA